MPCFLFSKVLVCGRNLTWELNFLFSCQYTGSYTEHFSRCLCSQGLGRACGDGEDQPRCEICSLELSAPLGTPRAAKNRHRRYPPPSVPVVVTGMHDAWAQTWGACRFPRVPSPPWSNGCVPAVHDTAVQTPPALPCLQHAEQNASQRSWRWGSSTDWAIPIAESKFPEMKDFYIHILHHLSMAPDWNSWFTQGLVNRDLACLAFLPCSLQVEDNSNNDVYTFLLTSAQLQCYYSEKTAFKPPMLTWCNQGNQTTWGIKYQGESGWEIV